MLKGLFHLEIGGKGMERLTGRDVKLGFVDSDTLPSYVAIYEKLQEYENLFEDKKVFFKINTTENSSRRC